LPQQHAGSHDVALLAALGPRAKQDVNQVALAREVHPLVGAEANTHFHDAAPRALAVAKVDALEDDPVRVQSLRLRSELLMRIAEELRARSLTQARAAELLCVTQPRVCALLQGKIEKFRLDSLIDIAHRLGLRVAIEVAA
jgi:predicted XRE-type DNA-binding protein